MTGVKTAWRDPGIEEYAESKGRLVAANTSPAWEESVVSALLTGMRVIDLTDGVGQMCGRHLVDLGAEVICVEPPAGSPSRVEAPLHEGVSLPFVVRNVGKRSITADLSLTEGKAQLRQLLATADVLVLTEQPEIDLD